MTEKRTDVHMGEPGFFRKLFRTKKLESVFLFVTGRCNSNCRTCFYSGKVSRGDDLTLEQITRVARTAPAFDKLWLSGGEPFLRKDLVEVIEAFYRHNEIKTINLPTNGLLEDRIARVTEQLLERCPKLTVHLNFSFDGMARSHDAVRRVKDGFLKTNRALERVEMRLGDHRRLHCNAATVITPDGLNELLDLGVYLFAKYNLSTHFYETLRGDPRDSDLARLDRPQLKRIHERLLPLYAAQAERLFAELPLGLKQFAKFYFLGVIAFMFRQQERNVEGPCAWPMECTAGKTTLVIDHEGSFRACELRPRIGRLQDYDFDLRRVLRSSAFEDEVEAIGGGRRANCWCTHTCWMLSSLKFSPRTLLYEIPAAYMEVWKKKLPPFVSRSGVGEKGLGDLEILARRYPEIKAMRTKSESKGRAK
jgi:MoaA/NifB/PqqE/SkfB family radical SAM enzyme